MGSLQPHLSHGLVPTTAVCLLGQPAAIDKTAVSLNTHLLNHWDADAFVFAHNANPEHQPSDHEVAMLRDRLGPRVVTLSFSRGATTDVMRSASKWMTGWNASEYAVSHQAHPVHHWNVRKECFEAIQRHEFHRGVRYESFMRVNLDTMLFRPLPRDLIAMTHRSKCTAVVPKGDDLNGRMLIANRCGFEADAHILQFMQTVGDQNVREEWSIEAANEKNLVAHGTKLLREPIAQCQLGADGACTPRALHALAISADLMPALLREHRHLCGGLLATHRYAACDPKRKQLPDGHELVQTDSARSEDPGFCVLQRRCYEQTTA